jgi:N-sulfoglucosamine sulfohydrolase
MNQPHFRIHCAARISAAFALTLLGLPIRNTAAATAPRDARPNILFCIADDWGWPHAGAYGDKVVKTPTFDRVAREGILFTHAFSAAPSCTPSRGPIMTGQAPQPLKEGGNLWGFLPKRFQSYADVLEESGYVVGHSRKAWGPGSLEAAGRSRDPSGPAFKNFAEFLKALPQGKPFCYWWGSSDPHRPYEKGSGVASGMKLDDVFVPPYLPDTPEVRGDICDYYFEVERFDRELGAALQQLQAAGQSENTIVVITGDNGWPFPRSKANLYDSGTRQPLAVRWPAAGKPGRVIDDFINLTDVAPTFLEAARLKPPPEMTGRSFFDLIMGAEKSGSRNVIFLERERHANVRAGDVGYPVRVVRTKEFLYLRNLRADRWPAGDPQAHKDPKREYGDCDDGPTKNLVIARRDEPAMQQFFQLAFGKRPAEELYDVRKDPFQLHNLAGKPEFAEAQQQLRARLDQWMKETGDPRVSPNDDRWDKFPYFGGVRQVK